MPLQRIAQDLASLQRTKKKKSAGMGKEKSLPQQRKDIEDFVAKRREDINGSWQVSEPWRRQAVESYDFVEHRQWDDEDAKKVKADSPWRPILTFNDVLPIVRILSGIERQNREDYRIVPRQGADVNTSQMMTELFRYCSDQNLWFYQKIRKSNDVNITGKGFIKLDISYEHNVLGDILLRRWNPLEVFEDPLDDTWDGSDRNWAGSGLWVTEDQAKELWPEFEDQLKIGEWLSSDNGMMPGHLLGDAKADISLFLDKSTRRARIFDYWYKHREVVPIAVNSMIGDAQPVTESWMKSYEAMDPMKKGGWAFIRKPVTTIRVATFCNWLLLEDKESPLPFNDLPITRYVGLQYFKDPFGAVHPLKDAQRLKNKAFSQAMNHLNRSANSGWKNHATKDADPKVLQAFGSAPGIVINYQEVMPQEIEPVPLSQGHFQLMQIAAEQIKNTSLVNAELQGMANSQVVSGRAIKARQQGGLTGNEDLFDNGLLGDRIVGAQIIESIKMVFPPERIQEIIDNAKVRNDKGVLALMAGNAEVNVPATIQSCLSSDYDYIVDRASSMSSVREQQLANMVDIMERCAKAGLQIPKALIKAAIGKMDLPDDVKAEVIAEIDAPPLPPGMPPMAA